MEMNILNHDRQLRRDEDMADTGSVLHLPRGGHPSAYQFDERRKPALAEVDNASFRAFHVQVALVAGVGFFTDAYDIFAISIASQMLGYRYGNEMMQDPNTGLYTRALSSPQSIGLKAANLIGILVGQIVFGWLADMLGRKRTYGFELMIIVAATFCQALAGSGDKLNIIAVLIFWRFVMGIGIGADYPLSAVIASEFSSVHSRGRMMASVFGFQAWGQLSAALIGLIIVSSYKDSLVASDSNNVDLDTMWRVLIGLGCVPGAVALYFRLTITETPRYTIDIARDLKKASEDIAKALNAKHFEVWPGQAHPHRRSSSGGGSYVEDGPRSAAAETQKSQAGSSYTPDATWVDFKRYFRRKRNMLLLLGAAYSWFAQDVAFYGLNLNQEFIISKIFPVTSSGGEAIYQDLRNLCVGNLILCTGLIPGYLVCLIFIDRWGRKPIQFMGFGMLTILFVIMGFGFNTMTKSHPGSKAFLFLYVLAEFFQNFGPNTTTFIVPGEVFATRYRSTAHGICAASGKLGAVLAQIGFSQLKDNGGQNAFLGHIIQILALFMLTGLASTILIKETKRKTLEELVDDDEEDEEDYRNSNDDVQTHGATYTPLRSGRS